MNDLGKDKKLYSVSLDDSVESFMFWAHALEEKIQIILDTSLPNKQQHRAASTLLHDQFVEGTVQFKIQLTEQSYPLHLAEQS